MPVKVRPRASRGFMWDTIKNIVGTVAPVLGGAIGGPFGALAGSVISKVVTGKDDSSPDEILNKLQGNPELLLKVKQEEHSFILEKQKLEVRQQEMQLEDVQDARKREVEYAKTGKNDWMMAIVGMMPFVFLFACLYILTSMRLTDNFKEILYMLVGSFSTMAISIVSYYFGSSSGSKSKDAALINKK